jgi:hypothetical protein
MGRLCLWKKASCWLLALSCASLRSGCQGGEDLGFDLIIAGWGARYMRLVRTIVRMLVEC